MTTRYQIDVFVQEVLFFKSWHAEVWDVDTGETLHTTEKAETNTDVRRLALRWCRENLTAKP